MKDQGKQLVRSNSRSQGKGTTRSGAAPLGSAGEPGKIPRGAGQGWAQAPPPQPDAFSLLDSQGKDFFFFNRAPWRHQSNFQGGLKPPGSLLDPFCRVNLMLVISEQVKQLRRWWLLKGWAV